MENYRLDQLGQEVQDILNGAAMQVDLTAETQRATDAEQALQGNIEDEEIRAKAAEKQNADDIDALEEKIPSDASSSNKLATKEYVDDSVATNTATFRGTFNLVSELHLTLDATEFQIATQLALAIDTADNNDYCFIQVPTSSETPTEIKEIDRYKFNGTAWSFEYKLNNSGFTSAQWAAINSGITSNDVTKLSALPTNAQLTTLLGGKQDTLTFDNVPTQGSNNPVKSGGVYSADKALSDAIEAILLLIPSAASSLNQLADKAFVNSSIATATATFRGTFNLVTNLHLTSSATSVQIGTALAAAISGEDNNDYAFVQIPTSDATPTQIAKTERYKYNGTAWEYEYDLNNSGYTAAQWAAINSGITEALVTKLSALPTNAEYTTAIGTLTSSITAINQKIPAAAAQNNKLVDTAALESYIVQVLGVLTASFNITSSDGHVTVQISQVDGKITSVAVTGSDIASAASLSLVAGRVTTAEDNISTNSDDIAMLQAAYRGLTQSDIVIVEPSDVWPVANPNDRIIYRVVDRTNTPPQNYSDYMYNNITMVLMAQYDNGIDDMPIDGSNNLVKSGGISKWVGNVNVREITIKQKEILLAQNVKKGTPIYINLMENPNSRNLGLFTGTRFDERDLIYILSVGEEVVFETIEDYEYVYLVCNESSDFGNAKVAVGMNCVPQNILNNKRHAQNSNIIVGEEGKVYGSEYTASFRKLVYSGVIKDNYSYSKTSVKIPVAGAKFLYYKNLRNTVDSTFGLFIFDASDNILLRFPVENEQNEGVIFLAQDYPAAAYVMYSPTKNQSLVNDSYIYLSSSATSLSSVKNNLDGIKRTASTSKGLLRYNSLYGDNISVYTQEDCAFYNVLLKRDGVTYYTVAGTYIGVLSDYIDLTGYNYVYYYDIMPNAHADYTGLHLYDSNKNHLAVIGEEGGQYPISGVIDLSDYNDVRYIRFSPINNKETGMIVLSKNADYIQPMDLLMRSLVGDAISADRAVVAELNEDSIVLRSSDGQWWNIGNANNGLLQTFINNRPVVTINIPASVTKDFFGLYFVYDYKNNTASYEVGQWIFTSWDLSKAGKIYLPIVTFNGTTCCYRAGNIVLGSKKDYVLDAAGGGDITTVDGARNLPVNSVVRVMPGRYKTTSNSLMNRGITFIGDDVDKCIFYNDDNDYFTAIHFYNGCCRNITFIAEENSQSTADYRPYAVHIDHAEVVEGVKYGVRFENCKFISYYAACVGIGMRKNFELSFINCDFIQKGSIGGGVFSLHNCVSNAPVELQGSGTVIMSCCRLLNEIGNEVLVFALKTNSGVAGGIMDQYPTHWIIQNTSFYSRTAGKNCIYANNPEGVYGEISAIPSAAVLDPQSFNNNIEMLNA